MLMTSSNYWYIYDRSHNDYAMDSLEREEIINLYVTAGSIPCVEQFTETLED
jgi:hypothetical protein